MFSAWTMLRNRHSQCLEVLLISVQPVLVTANTLEEGMTADMASRACAISPGQPSQHAIDSAHTFPAHGQVTVAGIETEQVCVGALVEWPTFAARATGTILFPVAPAAAPPVPYGGY